MLSERINKVLTFLRAETPTEDVAKNPVVRHPHNTSRTIPERLCPATIKELSALNPAKAIGATAEEWVAIAAAIAVCSFFWHPALYVAAVVVIGSRQHALLVLGHDALIASKIAFYSSVAGALTLFDAWAALLLYWIVPY